MTTLISKYISCQIREKSYLSVCCIVLFFFIDNLIFMIGEGNTNLREEIIYEKSFLNGVKFKGTLTENF